ncbi:LOXE3 isomerase, partial [Rhinopomastus cyanomelas]|nr:LOXE3 isomerase [Rhinopomastus cyanomelas]
MAVYRVTVATGDVAEAGTKNNISITLVGATGESPQTTIGCRLYPGQEKELSVSCSRELGAVVLVRLHKAQVFLEDSWFCREIRVRAPDSPVRRFPCYQWLEGNCVLEVREGSAQKLSDDALPVLLEQRRRELAQRQRAFEWKSFAEGWPHCLRVESVEELDSNVKFSGVRDRHFNGALLYHQASLQLSGFLSRAAPWQSLQEMTTVFSRAKGRDIGGCLPAPTPA